MIIHIHRNSQLRKLIRVLFFLIICGTTAFSVIYLSNWIDDFHPRSFDLVTNFSNSCIFTVTITIAIVIAQYSIKSDRRGKHSDLQKFFTARPDPCIYRGTV